MAAVNYIIADDLVLDNAKAWAAKFNIDAKIHPLSKVQDVITPEVFQTVKMHKPVLLQQTPDGRLLVNVSKAQIEAALGMTAPQQPLRSAAQPAAQPTAPGQRLDAHGNKVLPGREALTDHRENTMPKEKGRDVHNGALAEYESMLSKM